MTAFSGLPTRPFLADCTHPALDQKAAVEATKTAGAAGTAGPTAAARAAPRGAGRARLGAARVRSGAIAGPG